ncbi:MAG: glycosyltransferase family 4 protein [Isosphaeraceae bacterium]
MADAAMRVVLLAGRLTASEAGRLRGLVDALRCKDLTIEVVCVAGAASWDGAPGVIEAPGLGSPWRRPWAVRRLASADGPGRPDLLHALGAEMDAAALALAESWRVPYVQTVEEYIPVGGRLRLSRPWCRALVATSVGLADDLARSLSVPGNWIMIVPPGIAIPEHEPAPCETGRVPVVGASAPLVSGSGLVAFLGAARRIVDSGLEAEFVIAGEGPAEADLRRVAERLGVVGRVTFATTPGDGSSFWRVLNVFCQPSRVPNTGRCLAMALAHGVPAVVSDVDGLRCWLDGVKGGRLVPPGDPVALSRAILDLLADPVGARDLGRRGRERVARDFAPDREADRLADLYRRIMEAEPTRRPTSETGATPSQSPNVRVATRRS